MTLPRRTDAAELLDAPRHDRSELDHSLRQVAAVNRWLGGRRSLLAHLGPAVREGRPGRVLDVGTGNAELLRELVGWAVARSGARWEGVGVDLHPQIAEVAAGAGRPGDGVTVLRADGLCLPFADGAFSASVSSLTLHHFDPGAALRLLHEMARVTAGPVVVSDLERSGIHYLGARLLALLWWRTNRLTRHDGPLSVLRAYTAAELRELVRDSALEWRVHRHHPFRVVLEAKAP